MFGLPDRFNVASGRISIAKAEPLQPVLWAQQPHKPNEVRERKNKRAVGFRRVVRENTDDAIEPLNLDPGLYLNPPKRLNPLLPCGS